MNVLEHIMDWKLGREIRSRYKSINPVHKKDLMHAVLGAKDILDFLHLEQGEFEEWFLGHALDHFYHEQGCTYFRGNLRT